MNDHLTDVANETHGASFEALTAMAALVHRVPGGGSGTRVLSTTFRHPAVLAKAATVMDHATGGRFIVGLGAGWHEGEHVPFGIPMPPMPERFDRFESAVHVLRALWSAAAAGPPGVTRPDPFYPLAEATNEPPPLTPGGPRLWLGGQKRRGIALAAAVADGWALPAVVALGSPSDLGYFSEKRERHPGGARGDRARPVDVRDQRPGPDRDHRRGPALGARPGRRGGRARRHPCHPRDAAATRPGRRRCGRARDRRTAPRGAGLRVRRTQTSSRPRVPAPRPCRRGCGGRCARRRSPRSSMGRRDPWRGPRCA